MDQETEVRTLHELPSQRLSYVLGLHVSAVPRARAVASAEGSLGAEEGNGVLLGNCEACPHQGWVGSIQKRLLIGLVLISQSGCGLWHLCGGDEETVEGRNVPCDAVPCGIILW